MSAPAWGRRNARGAGDGTPTKTRPPPKQANLLLYVSADPGRGGRGARAERERESERSYADLVILVQDIQHAVYKPSPGVIKSGADLFASTLSNSMFIGATAQPGW